jgi:hypothetical protein
LQKVPPRILRHSPMVRTAPENCHYSDREPADAEARSYDYSDAPYRNAKILVRIPRETRFLKKAGFPDLSGKNF